MIEFLYIPIILLLYTCTFWHNAKIDDHVERNGYGYIITQDKTPSQVESYKKRYTPLTVITTIGIFMAVCGYVHLMFGWEAAVLMACFPLNVIFVAWKTGSYYSATTLLVLATHYFLTFAHQMPLFGAVMPLDSMIVKITTLTIAQMFYIAMLNTTVSGVPYILLALFFPYGWTFIPATMMFVYGRRISSGIRQRAKVHENLGVKPGGVSINTLLNVPRVLAYYLFISLWPSRLGLFHWFGKNPDFGKPIFIWISSFLCLFLGFIGWQIDYQMTICWFLFIGLYSQWNGSLGQFVAERYLCIANVPFCVIMATILMPYPILMAILAPLWFYRSHIYIKAFENNGTWMTDCARNFPKSPEGYTNLANLYMDEGRFMDAVRPLLQALTFSTGGMLYTVYANLSVCYLACAMYDKAKYYTILAINDPNRNLKYVDKLKNQLEEIEQKMKRVDRDRKELKKRGII